MPLGLDAGSRDAEDRHLRPVDDRRKAATADATEVGDREGSALHFIRSQPFRARAVGEVIERYRNLSQILRVGIADDRYQKTTLGVHSDPDVDRVAEDHFLPCHVDRGVEHRVRLEGGGNNLDQQCGHRKLAAGGRYPFLVRLPELLEVGDIGDLVVGDMRNREPGPGKVLCRQLADFGHRLPVDRSETLEIRQLEGQRRASGRGASREPPVGLSLDVVNRDAAAMSAAGNSREIYSDLACETTHGWGSGDGWADPSPGRIRNSEFGIRNFLLASVFLLFWFGLGLGCDFFRRRLCL